MPYFGNTTGIEYLDPSTKYVGEYFASFVQGMVDAGYVRGKSIRAAPYDFRSAPGKLFISKLIQGIDKIDKVCGKTDWIKFQVLYLKYTFDTKSTFY